MDKYISEDCKWCEHFDSMYGCLDHSCQIYTDYQAGMEEMAADFDHDKRNDDRLEREFYDKNQGELF